MSVGPARLRDEADVIRNGCVAKGEDPSLVDQALVIDSQRRELLGKADAMRAHVIVQGERFTDLLASLDQAAAAASMMSSGGMRPTAPGSSGMVMPAFARRRRRARWPCHDFFE